MKIGDRIFVRGYIDEIRKDTVIVRNDGGYFGTVPSEVITGELPSAQLEHPKGHWIVWGGVDIPENHGRHKCSECGEFAPVRYEKPLIKENLSNFCPNCGADMRGEQDE